MLKRKFILPVLLLTALLLAACGGGEAEGNSDEILTQAAQIAADSLTQTAAAAPPTSTPTEVPPTPTNTPEAPTATPTQEGESEESQEEGQPALQPTATQANASTGNTPCLRASFETETIPDGTEFVVNQVFTKTWRVKNSGSCSWGPAINLIWVEGDLMEADAAVAFTEDEIFPGQYAEIEVRMEAPPKPGTYKGYWMLRTGNGEIFGVGPDGKAWLWVEIKAYDPD